MTRLDHTTAPASVLSLSMGLPPRARAAAAAAAAAACAAAAPVAEAALPDSLERRMRAAGSYSGAYVYNATDGEAVFRWRHTRRRILASNTKLFTTAAALARWGPKGTLGTEVRGDGFLEPDGTWRGDLYLVGGGDPTFGSRGFVRRSYRSGASVQRLAAALEEAGIRSVSGRIYGDESAFDSRRGISYSGFATSIYVGPLSALAYNRGLARESGSAFQTNPPVFAARMLRRALKRRDMRVARTSRRGRAPEGLRVLASVDSPPMRRLISITNKPSDNFFAEMLIKAIGRQATEKKGTTRRGTRHAARFARELGSRARLADGSGLSRRNQASPYRVVRLLRALRERPEFRTYYRSLALAGRDGTLATRMRSGAARRRCRAKTGTISGVSTLSGYCRARSGDLYVFSFLMNGVNVTAARGLQDRMANSIAAQRE